MFRTYNASITLQNQLNLLTKDDMTVPEKLLAYNRANRAVAILCNHQRSVPKSHEKSMENLKEKIRLKREAIDDCESEYMVCIYYFLYILKLKSILFNIFLIDIIIIFYCFYFKDLKKQAKRGSVKEKINADKKGKQLERLKEQLKKLELQETDRDENKTIALGTSKLNYLDPRISVAWLVLMKFTFLYLFFIILLHSSIFRCKKHGVPIEKIFNKTQRTKFLWAIHMADENYVF